MLTVKKRKDLKSEIHLDLQEAENRKQTKLKFSRRIQVNKKDKPERQQKEEKYKNQHAKS